MKSLILFCLVLTSCTHTTIIKPEEVKVPVAVSCVSESPTEPDWKVPKTEGNHADKVEAMAEDLNSAHGYIKELEAIINGCK